MAAIKDTWNITQNVKRQQGSSFKVWQYVILLTGFCETRSTHVQLSVKRIAENKQVDHILLLSGKEGLRRYNSWSFGNDADRRNPSVIWEKFLKQIEPQVNFRIARFCLQNYSQEETENIDDFLGRWRLQAQKGKFRDQREMEERIIDQIIAGTKFSELQKQLLSKRQYPYQKYSTRVEVTRLHLTT